MQPTELPTAKVWGIIHYYNSLQGKPIDYLTVQFNFLSTAYVHYWDTKCKSYIERLILHNLIAETVVKKERYYHLTYAGLLVIKDQATDTAPFFTKASLLLEEQALLYTINLLGTNATCHGIISKFKLITEPPFNFEKHCRNLVDQALITLYKEEKISRWKVKNYLYYSIKMEQNTAMVS